MSVQNSELVLGPWAKSFPPAGWGMPAADFLATNPHLSAFATPLLTIDAGATANNVALMSEWLAERQLQIAPHGKTTMAPALWQQLLEAGAWGITLATPWQVQLARSFGIRRILLANELVDPAALAWVSSELADPDFEFTCWVDSLEGLELMRRGLANSPRPLDVIVELGNARTGTRTIESALAIAEAVQRAPELRLAGVGGYEGSIASSREAADISAIEGYLDDLVAVHDAIWWDARPIVTAGGSAYFDLVSDRLGQLVDRATVILRSGAYQLHDEGFYQGVAPLGGLRSAIHGWSRVVSRPEPGLAILDGGKRDFPYDLGLPTSPLGTITKLNDQHAYLESSEVQLGQVLRLGLSHPCTAFDKWRLIPVIGDADAEDPVVIDLIRTYF